MKLARPATPNVVRHCCTKYPCEFIAVSKKYNHLCATNSVCLERQSSQYFVLLGYAEKPWPDPVFVPGPVLKRIVVTCQRCHVTKTPAVRRPKKPFMYSKAAGVARWMQAAPPNEGALGRPMAFASRQTIVDVCFVATIIDAFLAAGFLDVCAPIVSNCLRTAMIHLRIEPLHTVAAFPHFFFCVQAPHVSNLRVRTVSRYQVC